MSTTSMVPTMTLNLLPSPNPRAFVSLAKPCLHCRLPPLHPLQYSPAIVLVQGRPDFIERALLNTVTSVETSPLVPYRLPRMIRSSLPRTECQRGLFKDIEDRLRTYNPLLPHMPNEPLPPRALPLQLEATHPTIKIQHLSIARKQTLYPARHTLNHHPPCNKEKLYLRQAIITTTQCLRLPLLNSHLAKVAGATPDLPGCLPPILAFHWKTLSRIRESLPFQIRPS